MHICRDEIAAAVASLPFVSYAFTWVYTKVCRKKCCEKLTEAEAEPAEGEDEAI